MKRLILPVWRVSNSFCVCPGVRLSPLALVAMLGFALGIRAQTPVDPPVGMILWWRGENSIHDILGTHFGTLQGDAGYGEGNVGEGFNLDGSGDFVDTPNVESLNFGTGDFTVEFWVRFNATGGEQVLAEMFSGSTGPGWTFTKLGDQRLHFYVDGGISTPAQSFATGVWYHLAARRASGVGAIFMNGELIQSGPSPNSADSSSNFRIGSRGGVAFFLDGQMDEISLYGRGLTDAEILDIYRAGGGGKIADKPYFTTTTLPDGAVGVPYTAPINVAITPAPHTFTLIGGALPAGLELSPAGLIYGTPTEAVTAQVTILATSAGGQTNSHAFTLVVPAPACSALPGPIAWWRGQGDALDAAGTHHGTLNGNASLVPGRVGQGFSFHGNGDHLSVPDSTAWDFGTADFSIELWVKFNVVGNAMFIHQQSGAGSGGFDFFYSGSLGELRFGRDPANAAISRSWSPVVGPWYHVAVVRQANVFRLFVNGVPLGAEQAESGGIADVTGPLRIGGYPSTSFDLNGFIDDLAIYDRALSAEELAAISSAGAAGKCGALYVTTLSPLPNAGQGEAYSLPLATTGGTGPLSFSVLTGSLPMGLNLSDAGVLGGSPTGGGPGDFTVRVTDAQTRTADRHFLLKVNARPVFGIVPKQTVNERMPLSVSNPATDADAGDVLTYSLLDPPPGVRIAAGDGTITWTPDEVQGPDTYMITAVATDNGVPSLSVTNSFRIVVNEVNTPPLLVLPSDTILDELVPFSAAATAVDGDLPANPLTYELISGPKGLTVSPEGEIRWIASEDQGPGSYSVTLRVTDSSPFAVDAVSLSTTNRFQITVREVNTSPEILGPTEQVISATDTIAVRVTVSDADLPPNQVSVGLVSGPAGLAVDREGLVTWTPGDDQAGTTNVVTVSVTDDGVPDLGATHSFTLIVVPRPQLRVQFIDDSIRLSWPVSVSGFALEYSTQLGSSEWNTEPAAVVDDATEHTVIVPASTVRSFYRLKN
ncbi:MAG: hypothetical protein JNL10_09790 [Verrucomicrobiales bacterium]|nr:hypothetical protein [Verrucomicrobiales bacterium]